MSELSGLIWLYNDGKNLAEARLKSPENDNQSAYLQNQSNKIKMRTKENKNSLISVTISNKRSRKNSTNLKVT